MTALLAFVMLAVPALTTVQAARYPDIVGHWAETGIEYWSSAGVLTGYPDGRFRPDGLITRAEMSQVLKGFKNLSAYGANPFKDMKASDWYYASVLKCVQAGYIAGYEDSTFRGAGNLTREEAISMVSRTIPLTGAQTCDTTINDPNTISEWAKGSVYAMINARHVPGFSNHSIPKITKYASNTIAATDLATRAFVVGLLYSVAIAPTVTPTVTPASGTSAALPPGGGRRPAVTPSAPGAETYNLAVSIQETTRGGGGKIVGPYVRDYLAPDVVIAQIVPWIIAERADFKTAYGDPFARAIMEEGLTAYGASDAAWRDYVDKYIEDVKENTHGSVSDLKDLAKSKAAIGEVGVGTWVLVYNVQQGDAADAAGNLVYRQYTATVTIAK
jgi:hypothetical protein